MKQHINFNIIAKLFAYAKHKGLFYNEEKNLDYSFHLDMVVGYLKNYSNEIKIVGYLHDVIEDTEVTQEELAKLFGKRIATLVYYTTDEEGHNRKTRKLNTNNKLANIPKEFYPALIAKCADRLANMTCSYEDNNEILMKMYSKEYQVFRESAFREGLCDELWNKLDVLSKNIENKLKKKVKPR